MDNTLKKLADSFNSVSGYDYIYTLGDSSKKIKISVLSNKKYDFTHIFGLDHLKKTAAVMVNDRKQKNRIFKKILNNDITMETLSNDPNLLAPVEKSWNELDARPYTIYDRISLLQTYKDILEKTGTGKFYKWKKYNSHIYTKDGIPRNITINADFVLTLPTGRSENEKYYFFLYRNDKNDECNEEICLSVHSAFVDCCDLVRGQERPYTILKLDRQALNSEIENLFIHPNYKI